MIQFNLNNALPSKTAFYSIEKAIKEYRRFAQKNISKHYKDITVDQALILQFLNQNPDLSQIEIGNLLFKDNASITRMIELMVKKGYLERSINLKDRRRFDIKISTKGNLILDGISTIVSSNRKKALENVTEDEIDTLERILNKIIANCNFSHA